MSFPFLPKNPNCTGCNQSTSQLGCNNQCGEYIGSTDNIVYNGPILEAIGVEKCDSLTTVVQKISNSIFNPPTTTSTTTSQQGGGSGTHIITKAELDVIVENQQLIPGDTYIISGVDSALYDYDNVIMIKASTSTKLELSGSGVFYTPKYDNDQTNPYNGFGIWSKYITYSMDSNTTGVFTIGEVVTSDNGATGTLIGHGFISDFSGNWADSISFTGNTSGATISILNVNVPSYNMGDTIIWGGKHWTNLTGQIGDSVDTYNLNNNWEIVEYNNVDYNISIDDIKYDQLNDLIIYRRDRFNNIVEFNYGVYLEFIDPNGFGFGYSPIQAFQWGNGNDNFNTTEYFYLGVYSNIVESSYIEIINCRMEGFYSNKFSNYSVIKNSEFSPNSEIYGNLDNLLNIYDSFIGNDTYISLLNNMNVYIQNSSFLTLNLTEYSHNGLYIYNSNFLVFTIFKNEGIITIQNSNVVSSSITTNIFRSQFTIDNSIMTNSNIGLNTFINSSLYNGTFTDLQILRNICPKFLINEVDFTTVVFQDNTILNFEHSGSGTISDTTISECTLNYFGLVMSTVGTNLNSRTLRGLLVTPGIYNNVKFSEMFANSDVYLGTAGKIVRTNQDNTNIILTYYDSVNALQTVII